MKPQIPWLRIFVEGVVIVGSILLALGIEGAFEERSERSQEAELIERLLEEFRGNRRTLGEVISENYQFNTRALELGLMGPEALRILSDDSLPPLGRLGGWHIFHPVRAEYSSMLQSGEFRLIQSRDLRAALNGWSEVVELADEQARLVLETDNKRIEIFTAGGMYEAITRDQLEGENESSRQTRVLVELLEEGRIQQNLLSHRLFRARYIEVLESAMAQLDTLLALLERELAI